MGPEGSSQHLQEPATCPYPEPDRSGLMPPPPPNLPKPPFNIITIYPDNCSNVLLYMRSCEQQQNSFTAVDLNAVTMWEESRMERYERDGTLTVACRVLL